MSDRCNELAPAERDACDRHGFIGGCRPSQSIYCPVPKPAEYHGAYNPVGPMAEEAKRLRAFRIHAGTEKAGPGLAIFTGDDIAELHRRHAKRTGR